MKFLKIASLVCILSMMLCMTAGAIEVSAGSAIAIDADSGRVLYEKNAHERRGMASTTKIMTAIIALENGNLNDIVTIDSRAVGIEGSSLYLRAGDKITLKNLLYGMLLRSGNDAATAVALHFCPTVQEFAAKMTQKAKDLGLHDTQFKNPHGLYAKDHYTTAYDLAQITRYAFTLPGFGDMVCSRKYVIDDDIESKVVTNNNKLLRFYDGADGVKTGYTPETGRTLVGSATRNGMRVICVTLNDGNDWNDHMAMFDYSFRNYEIRMLTKKGQGFGCAPVSCGTECDVPLLAASDVKAAVGIGEKIQVEVTTKEGLCAPVKDGQVVGKVVFKENGQKIGETNLISGSEMEKEKKPNIFWRIIKWIMRK
ncbi:MAG: D-alanyl-D-alanine carboxypeptidase family protein [Bacillota bacterium]|nr:D-alanyl-D-alanine carboxypeptidase family protein [Bacillota bacterium]